MNTASLLEKQAILLPDKTAIVHNDVSVTFKELDIVINRVANYFARSGVRRGMKVLVFVNPSIELPAVTFALFKMGAIPVFIDPGMGVKELVKAIAGVSAEAMVAVPRVHILARIFPGAFKSVLVRVSCKNLREKAAKDSPDFELYDAAEDEMAAILFTSGGTGTPKGAVYTHKIFIAQTELLQEMFSLTSDDVDCPCFPLFSFFTIAMGMTSCVPELSSPHPPDADPGKVVAGMLKHKTTFATGSPAIWDNVADYCNANDIKLPLLRCLVMFGAPVSVAMHEKWRDVLPNGTTYTPYGATESLPISNISGQYILDNLADAMLRGEGTCVGKPVNAVRVMIYNGDEIWVSGDVVTKEYYNNDEATRESKLIIDGRLWHNTGDVGRIDEEGRLWYLGRKAHVVKHGDAIMYPNPVSIVFNRHPRIKQTALVGPVIDGRVVPSLLIEMKDGSTKMTDDFLAELREIQNSNECAKPIEKFYLKKTFPVDARHNIKIDHLKLREWVEQNARRRQ